MEMSRREVVASALILGTAAPLIGTEEAAAAPAAPTRLPLSLVNPEFRGIIPDLEKFSTAGPPLDRSTLAAARNMRSPLQRPPVADVPHERRVIPGGRGQPEVAIFIVNAKARAERPAILHTHGGGYVFGSAADSIRDLQDLCRKLDCVAVSVEYRLAPETHYQGSIEDNYAGLKWLHAHAGEIGADPKRIAVLGESAGGGHAALLAIVARDRGEVPLCFQCLVYPMLDDRTGSTRTPPAHVGTLLWTPARNRFGWESFLGMAPGGVDVPAAAVPARVDNLKGLPPAFIGVGTLDLFCDEDIAYAERLNQAAVMTELIVVPGAFHGFDSLPIDTRIGNWFTQSKIDALRRGFATT